MVAGPVEATALGSIPVHAVALGTLPDIAAGWVAVATSFAHVIYGPRASDDWDATIVGFDVLVGAAYQP